MRRKRIFVVISALVISMLSLTGCISPSVSQKVITWQKVLGGNEFDTIESAIPVDDGFLLIGCSESSDGDLSSLVPSSRDIWIIKVDESGEIVTQTLAGGSGKDTPYGAISLNDGGYIIFGTTDSIDIEGYQGNYDGLVIKLNENLNVEFKSALGDPYLYDQVTDMIQLNDGNIGAVLVSATDSYLYIGTPDGTILHSRIYPDTVFNKIVETTDNCLLLVGVKAPDYNTGIVIKLDKNLENESWEQEIENCFFFDIVEIDGKYVVAGTNFSGENGGWDGYVVTLDATNGVITSEKFFGNNSDDIIEHIKVTNDNSFIFAGRINCNGWQIGPDYPGDYWIFKTDERLNELWEKIYGGSKCDFLRDILVLDDGILAVGFTYSDDLPNYHGNGDGYVLKLKSDGNL